MPRSTSLGSKELDHVEVIKQVYELISAYESQNLTPAVIKLSHNMYSILKREAWDYTRRGLRIDSELPEVDRLFGIPVTVTNKVPATGVQVECPLSES